MVQNTVQRSLSTGQQGPSAQARTALQSEAGPSQTSSRLHVSLRSAGQRLAGTNARRKWGITRLAVIKPPRKHSPVEPGRSTTDLSNTAGELQIARTFQELSEQRWTACSLCRACFPLLLQYSAVCYCVLSAGPLVHCSCDDQFKSICVCRHQPRLAGTTSGPDRGRRLHCCDRRGYRTALGACSPSILTAAATAAAAKAARHSQQHQQGAG